MYLSAPTGAKSRNAAYMKPRNSPLQKAHCTERVLDIATDAECAAHIARASYQVVLLLDALTYPEYLSLALYRGCVQVFFRRLLRCLVRVSCFFR